MSSASCAASPSSSSGSPPTTPPKSRPLRVLGAHYVSCVGRGAPLFGGPGAELQIIAHNLGDIPLVGFFANGEIAGDRLYGYTGVLTLFVEPRAA